MKSLLVASLALPLVGCYGGERRNAGECPAGEVCSDLTPNGLDFIGNRLVGELLLSGPRPTAIGGTQAIALEYDRGDGTDVALDLPFTADDDGGLGVTVDAISGSQVVVRGVGSRSNYLRILDSEGLLMDRKELTGASLDTIEIVPDDFESVPPDSTIAFAAGPRQFGIALWGRVQGSSGPSSERLIDTSMEVSLAGAQRTAWDTLAIDAVVGSYPVSVTAGDKPAASLDLVVVDHADALASFSANSTIAPNSSATVCFQATAAGRYVAGLIWTYVIDGTETKVQGEGTLQRNCVTVSTTKTAGTVTIQASAGGQSATKTLTVGTARESTLAQPLRPTSHAIATAGDRAAM